MTSTQNSPDHFGPDTRFQIAHPRIIHQCHDSETLIIDLDTGHYYCLEGTAPTIWEGATAGASLAQIIATLENTLSPPDVGTIGDAVFDFINALVSQNLLTESHNTPCPGVSEGIPFLQPPDKTGDTKFLSPELSKFTDLTELLLADPIHEIEAMPMDKNP